MIFFVDMTNLITLLLVTIATALLIFLAQEVKKSYVSAIPLFAFLILLVTHVVQRLTLADQFASISGALSMSIAIDFLFVLVSFFAYLWVDDIEARTTGKKSLDNSLDWFWKNV